MAVEADSNESFGQSFFKYISREILGATFFLSQQIPLKHVRTSEALKAETNLGATEVLFFEECQTTSSPPKLHKVDKVVTKSDDQLIRIKWHLYNQITEILQYIILVYV
jgi:hypothetical protein